MREFAFMLIGAIVLGLLTRFGKQKGVDRDAPRNSMPNQGGVGNKTLYWVFVMLLAFSPVMGVVLSTRSSAWGSGTNSLGLVMLCSAVGVAASLPLSLALARVSGVERYLDYWRHLEVTMNRSKTQIIRQWLSVVVVVVVIGSAIAYMG
jgi:hypothetical protein